MIEADVVSYLLSQSPIAALIGNRMHANRVPSRDPKTIDRPLIVWQIDSDETDIAAGGSTGRRELRMEFRCQALNYPQTKQLAEAVNAALMPEAIGCPGYCNGGAWIDYSVPKIEGGGLDPISEDVSYHEIPVSVELQAVP